MFDKMENEEDYLKTVLFSDKATFHLSGKVNRHNERIWGTEDSHKIIEHVRDSPKLNVFCAVSSVKVYGPFCLPEPTVTGISYPDMVVKYLVPQLQQDMAGDFVFQRGGAPQHFRREVTSYLNRTVIAWIGRGGTIAWPPIFPDLTPPDFSVWGYD